MSKCGPQACCSSNLLRQNNTHMKMILAAYLMHCIKVFLYPFGFQIDFFKQRYTTWTIFEPPHDKTNKMACAPSEDSDQPGHPPSLIRVFAVRKKKAWVLSCPLSEQRRHWSDWADAQADLSLHWAHSHFVGFVTRRLIYCMCRFNERKLSVRCAERFRRLYIPNNRQ